MRNSIALIGFMATGKTTVGQALKKRLGNNYRFIETDQMIVDMSGKEIPKIFSEDGEIRFREYEMEACKKASTYNKVIISCGGGVVLNKINIDYLKQRCHIILLKTSAEEIYERAMKDGKESRPVIDKPDPMQEINKVLEFRKPFYNAAAEIVIDTTDKSVEEIIEEIIRKTQLNKGLLLR